MTKPPDDARSQCQGKEAMTWAVAKAVMDRMPSGMPRKKRHAYHCPHCRAWHVGGVKRIKREGKR